MRAELIDGTELWLVVPQMGICIERLQNIRVFAVYLSFTSSSTLFSPSNFQQQSIFLRDLGEILQNIHLSTIRSSKQLFSWCMVLVTKTIAKKKLLTQVFWALQRVNIKNFIYYVHVSCMTMSVIWHAKEYFKNSIKYFLWIV